MSGKQTSEKFLESAREGAFEIVQEMNRRNSEAVIPGLHDLWIFDHSNTAVESSTMQAKRMSDADTFIDPKRSKSIHRELEALQQSPESDQAVDHLTRARAAKQQEMAPAVEQAEFELI